ncbi:MAG: protein kinase [Polyangiaceae bacterium]|nr:protein kinase [Polyangiaceae bacterium]
MGVVYQARDLERGGTVALKTLVRADAGAIYRFKNEFRTLADLAHPNVVQLYELVNEGPQWFFTMELVDGVTFTRYVLGDPALISAYSDDALNLLARGGTSDVTTDVVDSSLLAPRAAPPLPRASPRVPLTPDFDRLREALRQLAEGVVALHRADKLHRDLKPSNVLVTRHGRVVVLDFGLARDLNGAASAPPDDPILGTPAYMAPEQASNRAVSRASDWYAVGSMLYECLTGRLPFQGSPLEMLYEKQQGLPPWPSTLGPGVPPDLEALCMHMLAPKPEERPRGDDVLRRLDDGSSAPPPPTPQTIWPARPPFFGRRAELEGLEEALAQVQPERPTVVLVRGESGVGKTALVRAFVDRVRATEGATVLSGRCYEREDVPYKAFDDVMDGLARVLRADPKGPFGDLLPPSLAELSLLFPVLATVPSLRHLPTPLPIEADPREVRRRAAGALKRLFGELTRSKPALLFVDDLQWGDDDSAQLLLDLLSPPDVPALLVVGTYRRDVAGGEGPVIEALGRAPSGPPTIVELAELPEDDAIELASALGGTRLRRYPQAARTIAREAQGHPLFVAELVRHVESGGPMTAPGSEGAGPSSGLGPTSLEAALAGRLAALPDEARWLLEMVALAGRPLELPAALRAAGLDPGDMSAARTLRVARLVLTRRSGGRDLIECAHDRVRGAADRGLHDEARREAHGRLADALVRGGRADPEDLWEHYLGAGDTERARHYALLAAEAAAHGLAFLRAARLYRVALEHGVDDPQCAVRRKLAAALVNGGHGAEAARVYAAAAEGAPAAEAFELRRLAAEHFLKGGLEIEGLALLRPLLREAGVSFPAGPKAALASLLVSRARLRLARLRPPERPTTPSPRDLVRADLAYTAALGLTMSDAVRGADFGVRALLLSLRAGEPVRVCRGLALVASGIAYEGPRASRRAHALADAARDLGERIGDPRVLALAQFASAHIPMLFGDWAEAQARLREAERLLSERCRGVHWETSLARAWLCNVLIFLGRLGEARRGALELLHEASERGDRFARTHSIYAACVAYIVDDDVVTARRVVDELFRDAAPDRYTSAHWGALVSNVSLDRYAGDGPASFRRMHDAWPALRRSLLLRVQMVRVFAHFERALCALAAADAGEAAAPLLRSAEADARRLLREDVPYARAMGRYALAAVLAAQGQGPKALAALQAAIDECETANLGYYVACARDRYGALLGAEGDAEREASRVYFDQEGVRAPDRCIAMSAPGYRRLLEGGGVRGQLLGRRTP